MKCIVEVISDTLSKPGPVPVSQECFETLRGGRGPAGGAGLLPAGLGGLGHGWVASDGIQQCNSTGTDLVRAGLSGAGRERDTGAYRLAEGTKMNANS